ncbi:MAG: flagellar protein FliT [Betaproteobacteria bacterium]|nr:flagellar protein FliT [Betaproteobacteria bacterium]
MMITATYLLGLYENIADTSEAMLESARAGNWQETEHLKKVALMGITEARTIADKVTLTANERKVKIFIMRRILSNDAELQKITQPWLQRVSQWIPARASQGGIGTALR